MTIPLFDFPHGSRPPYIQGRRHDPAAICPGGGKVAGRGIHHETHEEKKDSPKGSNLHHEG